jgi:galactonate dehydratase
MDIMVEFHSMWNLPMAVRIAQALEEFKPYWAEDPIQMTNLDTIAEYRSRCAFRSARARPWPRASHFCSC